MLLAWKNDSNKMAIRWTGFHLERWRYTCEETQFTTEDNGVVFLLHYEWLKQATWGFFEGLDSGSLQHVIWGDSCHTLQCLNSWSSVALRHSNSCLFKDEFEKAGTGWNLKAATWVNLATSSTNFLGCNLGYIFFCSIVSCDFFVWF